MRAGRAGPRNLTALLALVATGIIAASARTASPTAGEQPDVATLTAPHGEPGGFFTPWGEDDRSFWRVLRWQLFTPNPYDKSGPPDVPVVPNDGT